ncbi:MAG: outer membrane lipid asymmetry maintenance protein MlaD [Gammaproteobacteria bacterium]|nr:outer membrane lipid asymmetry maintenance protein MlaD [Gammaproteobacteria bacterium]PCH64647.1 MAG: outer membrane lipid asymmetry maintenance protein MlaD [Gammaproteobacteria bacterium]
MYSKMTEIAVGLFVAAGVVALVMLAMKVSNLGAFSDTEGYTINARFENIGGLKVRSPVRLGGVRVGRVNAINYDQNRYEAVVEMTIANGYDRLPIDTSANIFTSGLLGEQYVGLEPGAEEEYLGSGGVIELTQSAIVIEQLIGQFLLNSAE